MPNMATRNIQKAYGAPQAGCSLPDKKVHIYEVPTLKTGGGAAPAVRRERLAPTLHGAEEGFGGRVLELPPPGAPFARPSGARSCVRSDAPVWRVSMRGWASSGRRVRALEKLCVHARGAPPVCVLTLLRAIRGASCICGAGRGRLQRGPEPLGRALRPPAFPSSRPNLVSPPVDLEAAETREHRLHVAPPLRHHLRAEDQVPQEGGKVLDADGH
eukprot:4791879-Prymnesium_polylepis.1